MKYEIETQRERTVDVVYISLFVQDDDAKHEGAILAVPDYPEQTSISVSDWESVDDAVDS